MVDSEKKRRTHIHNANVTMRLSYRLYNWKSPKLACLFIASVWRRDVLVVTYRPRKIVIELIAIAVTCARTFCYITIYRNFRHDPNIHLQGCSIYPANEIKNIDIILVWKWPTTLYHFLSFKIYIGTKSAIPLWRSWILYIKY